MRVPLPRRWRSTLATLLLASGCSFSPLGDNPLGGELTVDREREVTADVAHQIRDHMQLVDDPVLLAYVNELGQEIVRVTEPQPFIYRFAIIDDEGLNAFTIGGGYVYMNSGVLAQAGDGSELVGVLAHEIAHVRMRHIAKRSEGQGIATLATLAALAAVALAGGDPGLIAIGQGINVALQLQHSRADEAEADREGIAYMMRAGYDPDGMTRFFERILAAYPDPGQIPPYLYTHPALRERIAASRVEIQRIGAGGHPPRARAAGATSERPDGDARSGAPPKLEREDRRLAEMQARLATLLEPVAGGSGLRARVEFDRSLTEPLLEEARAEREAGRLDAADLVLASAEQKEPNDPRVALARAELAEERGELAAAEAHLRRAFELDAQAPLVKYRLGLIHKRLGNRTRAVFYLEQAATSYRAGSAGRERAELEIERLAFPILERSGLGRKRDQSETRFTRGERVTWWGELSRRYMSHNPAFELRWLAPDGRLAHEETVRMNAFGNVSATLQTEGTATGKWSVEIVVGDSAVDRHEFWIVDPGTD